MKLRASRCSVCFLLAVFGCIAPAMACLWDYDTIRDERRGLPGIAEILAGRFEKHSKFFYEQRIARMEVLLKSQPKNLDAWDNLAAAWEKLGDHDKAIEIVLKKEAFAPGKYTTWANLGTFYLHKGDLEHGIAAIRKALDINPEAHFGREEYQLKLALYYRDARKNQKLLTEQNFLEYAGLIAPIPTTVPSDMTGYALQDLQKEQITQRAYSGSEDAFSQLNLKPNIFDGIVGMIRFGPGDSPELFLALGDLLALRGDILLAHRAYQRALDLNHPRAEYLHAIMKQIGERVYYQDQISPESISKERADGATWVKAYQDFEDDLVRRGVDTDDPNNYAPFYAKHPAALRTTFSEATSDWWRHNKSHVTLFGCVAFFVGSIALLVWRDRRRRLANRKASTTSG